jgi:Domain of unknown function (DUF1877)
MVMIAHFSRVTAEEVEALVADASKVKSLILESATAIDIDQSWDGLHFLLTGKTIQQGFDETPLAESILGGNELIGAERGFGLVRYHTATAVKEIAEALAKVTEADLLNNFDEYTMEISVSGGGFSLEDGDFEDYLYPYFQEVVEYYQIAARENQAMLLYLN